MAFSFNVPMEDGSVYTVRRLLAAGQSNTKTAKSDAASADYLTYSLSLAPHKASGFNLCASASAGCIKACIFTSGYARVHPRSILPARIAKTRMLRMEPKAFMDRLCVEIHYAQRKARKLGKRLALRPNVFSDVLWEKEFPSLFAMFPEVQFYDYTKHVRRYLRFLAGQLPANYHLTFSRSENNHAASLDFLRAGGTVAVPFHVKYSAKRYDPLPASYASYPVYDGDKSDLRFLDPKGHVIGLRVKGQGKGDTQSGFVVTPKVVA